MARAAFAIGAGYMNTSELLLRVTEEVTEGNGVGQIFFVCAGANTAIHREPCKEIVNSLVVSHATAKLSNRSH
jgi:hypothetical protein